MVKLKLRYFIFGVMNSTQIFEMALGLAKPWYVSKIDMVKPTTDGLQGQLDIYLDFEKGF